MTTTTIPEIRAAIARAEAAGSRGALDYLHRKLDAAIGPAVLLAVLLAEGATLAGLKAEAAIVVQGRDRAKYNGLCRRYRILAAHLDEQTKGTAA